MFDLAKYNGEYGYIGLVDTMVDMMMNGFIKLPGGEVIQHYKCIALIAAKQKQGR